MAGQLSIQALAGMFDQTLLKPNITNADLHRLCQNSMKYGFKTVAINNAAIPICREYLQGSNVFIDAAVSFPLGQCTLETKVFETQDAIAKGAGEVDYVINIVELKNQNFAYLEREMRSIVDVCRKGGVVSKVIFENCYLTDDEKKRLCDLALQVCPDFIKTSTGFGTSGATVSDVALMKACVGNTIKVKASGGVRTLEACLAMIDAGAERIGTSAGVAIIEDYKKRYTPIKQSH